MPQDSVPADHGSTSPTARVRVANSPIEGKGLFAVVAIPAGAPIFGAGPQAENGDDETAHVIMTDDEFLAYIKTVDRYSTADLGDGRHRVSLRWTDADYGNHSCDPNAWPAEDGLSLVARRNIGAGEEVTTDYALYSDSPDWEMACRCGATACRGTIRGQDWRLPILQHGYHGHWPAFLAEKINARRAG